MACGASCAAHIVLYGSKSDLTGFLKVSLMTVPVRLHNAVSEVDSIRLNQMHKGCGARVRSWLEQSLAPTLAPGDVVILDNLGSHKGQPVRQARAHLLFLPPYSPAPNPIEMMFSK